MIARASFVLALVAISSPSVAQPGATLRELLLGLSELREQNPQARWPAPTSSPDAIPDALAATSPEALARLESQLPALQPFALRLERARAALVDRTGINVADGKEIALPNPDPLADCAGASGGAANAMLEAWAVSAEILAAAKWACLETTALGTNVATLCTAISIETESLQTEYELESFCLGVQADATVSALHDTQANVVDFVNLRADATVSSLASQVSLDALQDTVDGLREQLGDLQAALIAGDTASAAGLDDAIERANAIALQLDAVSADALDLRFRAQVSQAGLEDAQRLLATAKSQAARLETLGLQLRTSLENLRDAVDAADTAVRTTTSARRDRDLVAALGDPSRVILRYRLPAQRGGELERSRELLIRALTSYLALGADTSAAQALLAEGDLAFNQGRVLDAYDAFARAYRSLLDSGTTLSVTVMRDSFE